MIKTRHILSMVFGLAVVAASALMAGAAPSGAVIDYSLPGKTYKVQTPMGSLQPLVDEGVQTVGSAASLPSILPARTLLIFSGCPGALGGKTAGWVQHGVDLVGLDCSSQQFLSDTQAVEAFATQGTQADVKAGLVPSADAASFEQIQVATLDQQFASMRPGSWVEFELGQSGSSVWYQLDGGGSASSLIAAIHGGDFNPQVW